MSKLDTIETSRNTIEVYLLQRARRHFQSVTIVATCPYCGWESFCCARDFPQTVAYLDTITAHTCAAGLKVSMNFTT
jgi:hypothetical protein